ncbi:CARDB domain-containing protein [Natronospira bacteriovora]|uniref:CARDB domain-containing protein n=1 Tax=Natronospira bacteriovora TaxID=3069753 RepID=A0ABU0W9F1_9GAMM|nr:CARDB domain-containing protein [Natronospira sp. AB-CW4]MDQ2070653.1 CARDB domain-containing protein [Natronospira sp. AB-CW4]
MSPIAAGLFWGAAVGLIPVPDFVIHDSDLTVEISGNESSPSDYVYEYYVKNNDSNTGNIVFFRVEMKVPRGQAWPRGRRDLFVYPGRGETLYSELVNSSAYTPVQTVPEPGWENTLHPDVVSFFPSRDPGVPPGRLAGPFKIVSPAPPALRQVTIETDWALMTEAHDPTPEQVQAAWEVEKELRQELISVAPFGVRPNSGLYLEKFLSDMGQLAEMGWCGAAFTEAAHELVTAQREAIQSADYSAREPLTDFLDTLPNWEEVCSRREAFDLILYGVGAMRGQLPEEPPSSSPPPPPAEPVYEIEPHVGRYYIGEEENLAVLARDAASGYDPIVGQDVVMTITQGPHQGLADISQTNEEGRATFSYEGYRVGEDVIRFEYLELGMPPMGAVANFDPEFLISHMIGETRVLWRGGADLLVPFFSPPFIRWDGEQKIRFQDETENRGRLPVPETTTRYYISPDEHFRHDVHVVGERRVPPLEAFSGHRGEAQWLALPSQLDAGDYYFRACADADDEVVETDEDNNCATNTMVLVAIPDETVPEPEVPVCEALKADPETIWPPNHRMHAVNFTVTHPGLGNEPTIVVTGIYQDEPLNDLGDGNFEPDGKGVGGSTAWVRAERSGLKRGRIYEVHLDAEANGVRCEGSVTVSVPHDRRPGGEAEDSGERYDSTAD